MANIESNTVFPFRTELYAHNSLTVFADKKQVVQTAQDIAAFKTAQSCDDAFYVVDVDCILSQLTQWRQYLPSVEPFYAVKCNNNPVLLRILGEAGLGFDCASKQEIDLILDSGLSSADKIIYANPCKTRNYIRHAAANGIKMMTFDNEDELYKVKQLHDHAKMVLRIAVSDLTAQCPLNIKFGCDPVSEAPNLLQIAKQLGIDVIGISFHVGSGCNDPSAFSEAISHSRRLFEVGQSMGHCMSLLDLGGRFPGKATKNISFPQIANIINVALEEYFNDWESAIRLIAEPGRFFASAAFTLITNVIAKTKVAASRITQKVEDNDKIGFMYYLNDGVYGSFNCILYDHNQPEGRPLFERPEDSDPSCWTFSSLWGPTCDGLDQIVQQCQIRPLNEGDWIKWDDMGAYTCAAGSEFNGFPKPKYYYYVSEKNWNCFRDKCSELEE